MDFKGRFPSFRNILQNIQKIKSTAKLKKKKGIRQLNDTSIWTFKVLINRTVGIFVAVKRCFSFLIGFQICRSIILLDERYWSIPFSFWISPTFVINFKLLANKGDNHASSWTESKTVHELCLVPFYERDIYSHIAILICCSLVFQTCKFTANSAWQDWKFITTLQQNNINAEVTTLWTSS